MIRYVVNCDCPSKNNGCRLPLSIEQAPKTSGKALSINNKLCCLVNVERICRGCRIAYCRECLSTEGSTYWHCRKCECRTLTDAYGDDE